MNLFIKNRSVSRGQIIKTNYGLASAMLKQILSKAGRSAVLTDPKTRLYVQNHVSWMSLDFNKPYQLKRKKRIDELKRQSSWKSLRLRQGLPANGQRTHTNASVSKKLNASMYQYDI